MLFCYTGVFGAKPAESSAPKGLFGKPTESQQLFHHKPVEEKKEEGKPGLFGKQDNAPERLFGKPVRTEGKDQGM